MKLKYLDKAITERRAIAFRYSEEIKNSLIQLPVYKEDNSHVWHLFVVRCKQRKLLETYLNEQGVQTMVHYPIAPHQQVAYSEWKNLQFPITENMQNTMLSLPINAILEKDSCNFVIDKINNF